MTRLPDETVRHLADVLDAPDPPGDRYRVLAPIGRGGMGSVWLAEDRQLERKVAIKVMRADLDPVRFAERFRREALTVARLEHQSVVPIHEVAELEDGRWYAVMKYVEGETLAAWRTRSIGRNDALRLFLRLCGAIAFAHDRGVIHRDLKPANIMVGAFGELFVMDWGLAKRAAGEEPSAAGAPPRPLEQGATEAGAVLGTPGYMAPEQASGDSAHVTIAADIHALGGILEFLCTGVDPRPDGAPAPLPSRLAAIVAAARAPSPQDRYASVLALADDVTRFLDREPIGAYDENVFERAGRFLAKHQFVVWLVAAYLVIRVVVFFSTAR